MARSRATGPWALSSSMSPRARTPRWWLRSAAATNSALAEGGGVVEAVGGAVFAGGALAAFELFDMGGVFDLLAAVERARMGGEHYAGVEDAHGVERGRDGQGAPDVVVGDGIIVSIEPNVGAFGGGDLDALLAGERIVGERDEVGALLGEDVGDGALWVFGTGALGGTG